MGGLSNLGFVGKITFSPTTTYMMLPAAFWLTIMLASIATTARASHLSHLRPESRRCGRHCWLLDRVRRARAIN
jgi:hypothetical protein